MRQEKSTGPPAALTNEAYCRHNACCLHRFLSVLYPLPPPPSPLIRTHTSTHLYSTAARSMGAVNQTKLLVLEERCEELIPALGVLPQAQRMRKVKWKEASE